MAVSVTVVIVADVVVAVTNVIMTALAVPSLLTTSTQAETAALLLLKLPSLVPMAKLTPMHPVSNITTIRSIHTTNLH